LHIIDVAIV